MSARRARDRAERRGADPDREGGRVVSRPMSSPRGVKHQREQLGDDALVPRERVALVDAAAVDERHGD